MILPRRPRTFVIHVPKCAGTYLLRHHFNGTQVRRSLFRKVWYRGHIRVRDLGVRRIDSLVATIRNPWDWYSSYYHFLIKEIDPTNHPIRILSGDYDSFSTLTDNLSSPRFLDEKEDVSPIIYEDLAPDIFPFMKRTGTGFWTWTVLFHLSCKDTEEFNCLNDVLTEIRTIRSRVGFLRQEHMDRDVGTVLGFKTGPGKPVNVSHNTSKMNADDIRSITGVDGEAASELAGYVPPAPTCPQ